MCIIAQEQSKRIAILETVDKENTIPYGIKMQLRQSITFAISIAQGYEAYNRIDMSSITKEQTFQRTGMVSDADIKKIGVMTGAAYVLIAEAAPYDDNHIIISANLVNVETAQVENATFPIVSSKEPSEMAESCKKIAKILLNRPIANSSSRRPFANQISHVNYLENAWNISITMVWVEGGDFLMGCTSDQGDDCYDDVKNVRRVTIDGFWISMYEVTQAQWESVMGTSIYQQKSKAVGNSNHGIGSNYPMYYVNWNEAMEFCRLLSQKTGKTYTLPTEAQWEYAARGGINARGNMYSGSYNIDEVAWYTNNSKNQLHTIGTKQPNELGLYDMSGNVDEWCLDWYDSHYLDNDLNNPTGVSSGAARVNRGGNWHGTSNCCSVSYRGKHAVGDRHDNLGFRIVCIP